MQLMCCCSLWLIIVHGSVGNRTCSDNCREYHKEHKCDEYNEECLHGCNRGWWGPNCSKSCSNNCRNETCNQQTGSCMGCKNGKTGQTCSNDCPRGCQDNICAMKDEKCENGCRTGYCGRKCDTSCFHVPVGLITSAALGCVLVLVVVLVLIWLVLRRSWRQHEPPQYSVVMTNPGTYQNGRI
ncbi:multiple epidermal growth factor-like domains protein 10 [Haliotis cracherodii]|uniref:multiple epidermal growth factor-like domains protein 10 n=1 Tax=Haliotis cracherodii TaxID=6455 RepID=UPI0039ED4C6D